MSERDPGERTVYAAAGGERGLRTLAQAWHERVLADDVVAHAFSHGFDPHHTERLAAYWSEALDELGVSDDPLRGVLHDYFAWATTTTMAAYPRSADEVPDGLSLPRWSWDGLVLP